MPKIVLKIIIRPQFPQADEIVLEGDITHLNRYNSATITKLVWDIERTLNDNLPNTRSHIDIVESEKK